MRIAVLVLAASVLCLAQAPQPRLVVAETHHDFGTLAPASEAAHRFKLVNQGSADLHISQVKPSCGCTSSVVGQKTLTPGDSTEVEVTFHTAGILGHAQKTVEVQSDDPAQPSLILTFEAEVRAVASLSREQVAFRNLAPRSHVRASVTITSGTGHPLHIADMELSEAPWLGVATREEGDHAFVDLELLASRLPPAQLSGRDTLTVHVVNPQPSVLHLEVQWEKRPPVVAAPARVAWAEAAGRTLEAAVVLRQPQGRPFRILSARTSNPLLQVTGLPKGAAVRQTVKVVLGAEAKPGQYDDRVFLVLDTPGHPEFPLRVAAALR